MSKKLQEGKRKEKPRYKKEIGVVSYKDRSKAFEKSKKGVNLIKELENNKVEFDPHIKFTKVDPEKRTTKGFKIGKKGGEIYFEKKFKKGGRVCKVKPKLAKRGYK